MWHGNFSAVFVRGGLTQELHSTKGRLLSPPQKREEDTPCGKARLTEVILHFEQEQVQLRLRIGLLPDGHTLVAQAGICNAGESPINLISVMPLALEGDVEGDTAEWLLTLLNMRAKDAPVVFTLNEMYTPVMVYEYGGFYRKDGKGFLFGPVGAPAAYVEASVNHQGEGKVAFAFSSEMSGVLVKPGETRWGQQVALFTESPRKALPRWADWVAKTHQARTDKGALAGWNSYSFHGEDIKGSDVLSEVEAVLTSRGRLRPNVMEIDSGYDDEQNIMFPRTNPKFPEGLGFYARRIASTGARPGIILNFAGYSGFDMLAQQIRLGVEMGFADIKINRTGLSIPDEALKERTLFEYKREGFAKLREAAGEGTYLLYNESRPERVTVGMVDANRTGSWASRESVRITMSDVLRSYHLNGRWFAVDPDSYYMGTDIDNVSAIKGGWPLVRTWMSMVGLSCGAAITADPWHWESFRPYWRNVEVMTPPARERTEVLDLCTAPEWPRLLGHVRRAWGEMTVALLWNPGTTERTVTLDFAKVGMHPQHRYAVWSFWDNRYLGVAKGSWTTPALGPSASQHLRFTDLDCSPDKPVLIGSGLHIYCGAAEVKNVKASRDALEIELTDAGACEGDLFIYSRQQPVWKAEEGCSVSEIASAGENVWRINLEDRQPGASQRIVLGILLPVTQQLWFWALIGTVAASLLFGLWRYIVGVRLHERHSLSQERARIARDMHDEIGSRLARLSMLGEMAVGDSLKNKPNHSRVQEMARGVREAASELEHIIWAMNPRNDTLAGLVNRICQDAEEFFAETPIQCHFQTMPEVPPVAMRPEARMAVGSAVKEALANILKHASAKTVNISMQMDHELFQVRIEDDGIGFDLACRAPKATGGQGLSNMRTRLQTMGGECRIESAPGRGTAVILRWPLGKGAHTNGS
jgi:signal transduction histidine kinase